ncbi:MAG: cytochrome c oxidase subunit II [Gammaproteobacteria bacterium HGW-Gammaproteobacteria-4]|jgi:cytochrome c oxidase subunit 2|nr:MAG: cytochrome c oxidase subunit II [Gammaproteobacteria bacterium HGW-Gammaproteobacteria-4]
MKSVHFRRIGIGLGLLAAAGAAMANPVPMQLNMTPGVTEVSNEVYRLHNLIMWICVVIGVLVFGAMGVAMFRFRKSRGAVSATWTHNTTAEIIWTVIPVLILVAMAVPATNTLFKMYDTSEAEMTVKITGYQWMWRYEYLGENVAFSSRLDRDSDRIRQLGSGEVPSLAANPNYLIDVDNPLVLPTDTKIRFVLTADDVIHSWWVPDFSIKQDAIPGIVNEAWTRIDEPGLFRGQCAELCGKDHGFMPVVVKAVPRAEFDAWLLAQKADADTAARTAAVAAAR